MNKKTFGSKYSLLKSIKNENDEKNFKSNLYLVASGVPFLMMEIIPKNLKEKLMIISLIEKKKLGSEIKIYDEFEENEKLYLVVENSKESIKNLKNLFIKEEGIIFGQTRPIEKKEIDELFKKESSICKIEFKKGNNLGFGTGLFCEIKDDNIPFKKALFTNNHILDITKIQIGNFINLRYMGNSKNIEITKNRKVFTDENLDYSCIEIFDSDGFHDFFKIDPRIFENKELLKNEEIFILQFPLGGELSFSSGRIKYIYEHYLIHFASTSKGSSGSPIISRNNKNLILGLHRSGSQINKELNDKKLDNYNFNLAISFDSILNNLKKQLNMIITGVIEINEDNLKARIINSFENAKEELKREHFQGIMNQEDIKKVDIFINDQKIDFDYYYIFPKKGEYKIKYIFQDFLESTCSLFLNCEQLISLDLSQFNTENVKDMNHMFFGCFSLKEINLSNVKTQNTTDMNSMFCCCSSLKSLDVSSFDTQNVTNMNSMFQECRSLTKLDLSNFHTKNVREMSGMFEGCRNLSELNLVNFNMQNVLPMLTNMFFLCLSLKEDNLITMDGFIFKQFKLSKSYAKIGRDIMSENNIP